MKKIWTLCLFLWTATSAFAQDAGISGIIHDKQEGIPAANIVLKGDNRFGTITDVDGFFEIKNIPTGNYTLEISFVGYKTLQKKLFIDKNLELSIELEKSSELLDAIIITGVTGNIIAKENPIAVSSISAEVLNASPESNIIDVLVRKTPGLNVVKTGPNISKPLIRGLGYNRVLTLHDGIRQEGQQWGDEHGLEVDNYNLERAEIIKGPASLMFGSDALAGVVSLYSHKPKFYDSKLHGNLQNEFQSNNGLIGNALRLSYDTDYYVFELRGSNRMAKNYRNAMDGPVYLTNFNEKNLSALAGIRNENGYTDLNFTLYDNNQGIPDGSRDSTSRKFTVQIYEDDLDDDENRPLATNKQLNSYSIPDLSQHIQHYRLFMHSFYEFGMGNIDLVLAGQQNVRREYNHPTAPGQPGLYVKLNTVNYSLRYNIPQLSKFEFSTGINGMYQRNKNLDATEIPIPDYDLFDFGLFTFTKWRHEDWTISGGLRYDLRLESWDDFYVGVNPETGFTQKSNAQDPDAELPFPAFNRTFSDLSASIGATYRLTDQVSLKANVGRAFRAPNITELASNGLDPGAGIIYLGNRNFQPEVSLQEDISIIADYVDWSAELNLFNNYIKKYIFLNAVPDANGNPLVDNQGNRTYSYEQTDAHLYGGEIWFSIHPKNLPNLRLDSSYEMVYGLNKAEEYKGKGTMGEYLTLMPPHNFRSEISYKIKTKKLRLSSLVPQVIYRHVSAQNRYFGLHGTETKTDAYSLVDLGLTANFQTGGIFAKNAQFVFEIQNLFDTVYQNHLSRLKYLEDYENGNGIYDMGRNVMFKLILPF